MTEQLPLPLGAPVALHRALPPPRVTSGDAPALYRRRMHAQLDTRPAPLTLSAEDRQRLAGDVDAALSSRTRATYARHWGQFATWCAARGIPAGQLLPAPADLVALYLHERAEAGRAVATLSLDLAAICQAHRLAGLEPPRDHPSLALAWKGLRRRVGAERGASPNRKAPLLAEEVTSMVVTEPASLAGMRNRALLALGFAGGFRRSELVALQLQDLEHVPGRGVRVTVRRSKVDQVGEGGSKAVAYGQGKACPVTLLQAWRGALEAPSGPLFRSIDRWGKVGAQPLSGRSVARIVKAAAKRVGIDPGRVAGHSLRAGFVTSALAAGVSPTDVCRQTHHRSVDMVSVYDRRRDVWVPSGL